MLPRWLNSKESSSVGDRYSIPESEHSLDRKWQPTPVFLPENPMDRGAWQATVPGVTESDTTVHMSVRAREQSYFTTYYDCESVGRSPMTIYSSVSH